MIDITFKLNGTDYSHLLSTYEVTHEVEYATTITAIDGTEYGYGKRRPVVTVSFMPLTEEQTNALYQDLIPAYTSCQYTDPQTNTTRTALMRLTSNIDSIFGLKSIDGNRYYKGGKITLRQRTVL